MKLSHETDFHEPPKREKNLCWMELLRQACDGLYPTDQSLERLLDHIEGTP